MKIAMLGTRGVPARYGGFETAVEEIGAGLAERGHDVVVYSRGEGPDSWRGMRRVQRSAIRQREMETLSHTGSSALHVLRERPDLAIVFNAANAPWVALLRAAGIPTVLHVDGHDGRRSKWGPWGARYYAVALRLGIRVASAVVVDSRAVQGELERSFGVRTEFIPYGARTSALSLDEVERRLATRELRPGGYHLLVARFEPENQVLEVVRGYAAGPATLPLVVVGFAGYPGDYARAITEAAADDKRVHLLGAVWDQDDLDALYAGAASYVHGHSVGGTNPSLLRAMAQGTPVIAYDCVYNRETTGGDALWFSQPSQLGELVRAAEVDPPFHIGERGREQVRSRYSWPAVVDRYEELVGALDARAKRPGTQPTIQA